MTYLFLAGAMTATALFSSFAPGGLSSADPSESTEVTVEADVKTMPHFWSSTSFGELKCPAYAPRLVDHHYSDGVPPGVEVRTFGGDGIHVFSASLPDFGNYGRNFGIAFATVTNWAVPSAERSVQLVAHCTVD
ncbi:hypothetical protein [Agromyces silvae]|uniref:hypothetical protein n=1 Tax=Agromyces silvae TaxID=3388266 RepID=UPI00280BC7D9|nr:hypothetical protein [Agromyces protaetiae]